MAVLQVMTDSAKGSVKVTVNSGSAILYVNGSFAFHLQSEFRSAYEGVIDACDSVSIDLKSVDYMDSSGLGMLLVMKKFLDDAGISYQIAKSHGQTYDLLSMTHFKQYFRINGEPVGSSVSG